MQIELPGKLAARRFGGLANLARELRRPKTTVQRWVDSGVIPAREQPRVLAAAKRLGIPFRPDEIIPPEQTEEEAA